MRRLAWMTVGLAVFAISSRAMAQDVPPPEPVPAPQPTAPLPTEVPAPPVEQPAPEPEQPSVIVDAKDDLGHEIRSVTVLVDDAPVAYELDGKPIIVTPGPHTITLQMNDGSHVRVSAKVNLAAGESGKPVHLAFAGHAVEEQRRAHMPRPDPPVAPRVVVAAGLVAMLGGAIVIMARPASPANCGSTCTREAGQTDEEFAHTQTKQQAHDDVTHVGEALIGGGGGLVAAGLLWYFIELPPVIQDARISPWMTANSGGVSLLRTF